jgi:hypothetical protein
MIWQYEVGDQVQFQLTINGWKYLFVGTIHKRKDRIYRKYYLISYPLACRDETGEPYRKDEFARVKETDILGLW